jgi:hypothetical protein
MNDGTLFDRSYEEINHIARWYADHKGRSEERPSLLLIGGWAVYKHNPYTYSRDIDIIVNSNTRQSLVHWLRTKRGFKKQRDELGQQSVMLRSPQGPIRLDYVSTTAKNQFHGRKETLTFELARQHFIVVDFEEGYLPIPERGPLLLLKLKALHDRTNDLSLPGADTEWLTLKIAKDRSDILSLIDGEHGGVDIDLELVAKELDRLPFLITLFGTISSDPAACSLYRVKRMDAERIVGTFLSLVH